MKSLRQFFCRHHYKHKRTFNKGDYWLRFYQRCTKCGKEIDDTERDMALCDALFNYDPKTRILSIKNKRKEEVG